MIDLTRLLLFIVTLSGLFGCGGGGGGGTSSARNPRSTKLSSSDPRSMSSETSSKSSTNTYQHIVRGRQRVYRFPRNEFFDLPGSECPQSKPFSWTNEWFKTCKALQAERAAINTRDDDVAARSSHTTIPHLDDEAYEEIFFQDSENDHKMMEKYILEPRLHVGRESSVFLGHKDSSTNKSSSSFTALFKYATNCHQIHDNAVCDREWQIPRSPNPDVCKIQYDEDILVNEFIVLKIVVVGASSTPVVARRNPIGPRAIFVSPPVMIPTTLLSKKTEFKTFEKNLDYCQKMDASIRLIVQEGIGYNLEDCLYSDDNLSSSRSPLPPPRRSLRPEGIALLKFATKAFIRIINMLRQLHGIGFIHGNIDFANIAFNNIQKGCDFATGGEENLILINFESAEFFPFDLEKNFQYSDSLYAHSNANTLSLFELEGYRRSRRDDVYRAFEMYIDMITGRKVTILFFKILEQLKTNPKLVRIHQIMAQVKRRINLSAAFKTPHRCRQVFVEEQEICFGPLIDIIGNFPGISELSKLLSPIEVWREVSQILAGMEIHIKGNMKSPDSKPDYTWLIEQANQILINL